MNTDGFNPKPVDLHAQASVDKAADAAKETIKSTQQTADRAMNQVADKVDDVKSEAVPALNKLADTANSLVSQARSKLNDTNDQLRDQAKKATDFALSYTEDEPIKAVLIAAAAGALLMGMISVITR